MLYTLKHLRAIFFRLGGFSLETIKCPTQRQRDFVEYLGFDTCQGKRKICPFWISLIYLAERKISRKAKVAVSFRLHSCWRTATFAYQ